MRRFRTACMFFLTILFLTSLAFIQLRDGSYANMDKRFLQPVNQVEEKGMSAITIASLPFILAIKYLIIERDE